MHYKSMHEYSSFFLYTTELKLLFFQNQHYLKNKRVKAVEKHFIWEETFRLITKSLSILFKQNSVWMIWIKFYWNLLE